MKKFFALTLALAICFGGSALAQDFGLALNKAVTNIPPGADVMGMGNCWTATPVFSSNSPAILSIGSEEVNGGVSATYGLIGFEKGPEINIYSVSGLVALPVGYLQLTYSDARGSKSSTLMDADMEVDSVPTIDLQYGVKVGSGIIAKDDELHFGIGYAYGQSELKFSSLAEIEEVGIFPAGSESFSRSNSASIGAVYRPNPKISLGIFYQKSWSDDRENFSIPDVGYFEKYSEKSQADQFRAGIGWQILEMTFLAFDYQYLDFDGKGSSQFFAGIEQGIIKDVLYIYAGLADKSPTAGVGLYLENGGINVGYMHNYSQDLEPYLGKSHAIMATVYFNF